MSHDPPLGEFIRRIHAATSVYESNWIAFGLSQGLVEVVDLEPPVRVLEMACSVLASRWRCGGVAAVRITGDVIGVTTGDGQWLCDGSRWDAAAAVPESISTAPSTAQAALLGTLNHAVLGSSGIRPPEVREYIERLTRPVGQVAPPADTLPEWHEVIAAYVEDAPPWAVVLGEIAARGDTALAARLLIDDVPEA